MPRNLYHIARKNYGPTVRWKPHVPETLTKGGKEDDITPRIVFCPTIIGCLRAIVGSQNWKLGLTDLLGPEGNPKYAKRVAYVYRLFVYDPKLIYIPTEEELHDQKRSGEVWYLGPATLKLVGELNHESFKHSEPQPIWYD